MSEIRKDEKSIAVIGAGVAGLAFAKEMTARGYRLKIFEKSRGVGGRCATRRGDAGLSWDHGAQFFTCRSALFQMAINRWLSTGVIAPWKPRLAQWSPKEMELVEDKATRYVGKPRMNSFLKAMAEDLDIRFQTRVMKIEQVDDYWFLTDQHEQRHGPFSSVIVSAPAPQAVDLLTDVEPAFVEVMQQVVIRPTWALMLSVDRSTDDLPFDAAYVSDSPLSWVARNSSKQARDQESPFHTWVLHASHDWTESHLEDERQLVLAALTGAFKTLPGSDGLIVNEASAHRWRFAASAESSSEPCLWHAEKRLGVCGDAFITGRVEGAWLSGSVLARRMCGETADLNELITQKWSGSAG